MAAPQRLRGIAQTLPPGEEVLWEGTPDGRTLARRVFHTRKLIVYFGLLGAWFTVSALWSSRDLSYLILGLAWLATLGAAAVGLAYLLAWATVRTTWYGITDRRVVMKVGIAFPAIINIPLPNIEAVSFRSFADGTGDLTIALTGSDRLGYALLWPHARPWRFRRPEPALRAVGDAERIGAVLRSALCRCVGTTSAMVGSGERRASPDDRKGQVQPA